MQYDKSLFIKLLKNIQKKKNRIVMFLVVDCKDKTMNLTSRSITTLSSKNNNFYLISQQTLLQSFITVIVFLRKS